MNDFKLRPATRADFEKTGEILSSTVKAFVLTQKTVDIGIIGVHNHETALILFSWINPEIDLKLYKRGVVLAVRKLIEIFKNQRLPVFAEADETRDGSDRLLEHFGFEHYRERTYKWLGYR